MRLLGSLSATLFVLALAPALAATSGPAATMKTPVGTVLATSHGITLYTFKRDGHDESNCTGKCASSWPPFLASADAKAVKKWALVARPDGNGQWAYDGAPLYAWAKDQKPGEAKGNGLMHGA